MSTSPRFSQIVGRRPIDGRRGSAHGRRSLPVIALALVIALDAAGSEPGSPSSGSPSPTAATARRPSQFALAGRTVVQDQGAWVIDYRLRYMGTTAAVVAPEEMAVKVEGWVSNSRVASHAVPRHSSLTIARGPDLTSISKVIEAPDEEHRCREKLACRLSVVDDSADPRGSAGGEPRAKPLGLTPNGIVRVRLRLEHQHVIFGNYDPLLGARAVEITLAGATVRDVVALDHEQHLALPRCAWPEPPEDRRDTKHAISGPDSLHLEAHVPGHHYYRYPDRPVRYGTPMRLRFWYLIAAGTEGECRYRVVQYKDTPTSWRMLNDAGFEKGLAVVGRWTEVEHVFTTDAEATTLALDFRIAGDSEIGEMWIDDVRLEPVGCPGHAGP